MKTQKLKILLCEDDDDHADLIEFNLRDLTVDVSFDRVNNGADAVDYLLRQGEFSEIPRPDVVLLDLNLPKKNGLEVLAVVKNNGTTMDIPIIMLTTSASEKDLRSAYENHVNGFMVKPMNFDDFSEMLKAFGVYWGKWNRVPGTTLG